MFVDTNVFMYAVGRQHPLQREARTFLERSLENATPLVTSAEVLQELLHAYLPADRLDAFDAACSLVQASMELIWPIEPEDVFLGREMAGRYRALKARDLLHLACCRRRGVTEIKTFDRALAASFGAESRIG